MEKAVPPKHSHTSLRVQWRFYRRRAGKNVCVSKISQHSYRTRSNSGLGDVDVEGISENLSSTL